MIRIGTRGSALARWQAEHVAGLLRRLPSSPDVELVVIETEGDRVRDVALSKLPGVAWFTKELEQALLDGRADLAVHSLKDLATAMPKGLTLAAVLEREDPRDVLIARDGLTLDTLPEGARVGTSSLRRRAFLLRWRPDLDVADLRGNVPTRIEKLDRGEYDAIVLAAAGVKRLGMGSRIGDWFPPEIMLPAVSQGAIGVQARTGDEAAGLAASLDHADTRAAATAERALLREVEGGCQVPVGAHGTVNGAHLSLRAAVASLDGRESVEGTATATLDAAAALGVDLARDLLGRGAAGILDGIRAAEARAAALDRSEVQGN